MRKILQVLLGVGGVSVIGISLMLVLAGPAAIPGSLPVNATIDSK